MLLLNTQRQVQKISRRNFGEAQKNRTKAFRIGRLNQGNEVQTTTKSSVLNPCTVRIREITGQLT
jgi:hypothetical protein